MGNSQSINVPSAPIKTQSMNSIPKIETGIKFNHSKEKLHPDLIEEYHSKYPGLAYLRFVRQFRFLALSNEAGESFRNLLPRLVGPAYALSFAYIGVDSFLRIQPYYEHYGWTDPTYHEMKRTAVYHSLASLLLPTVIIGSTVKLSYKSLIKVGANAHARNWVPAMLGLAMIPTVVHPIEHWVEDHVMPLLEDEVISKED